MLREEWKLDYAAEAARQKLRHHNERLELQIHDWLFFFGRA
jgi:hypothetical protein